MSIISKPTKAFSKSKKRLIRTHVLNKSAESKEKKKKTKIIMKKTARHGVCVCAITSASVTWHCVIH